MRTRSLARPPSPRSTLSSATDVHRSSSGTLSSPSSGFTVAEISNMARHDLPTPALDAATPRILREDRYRDGSERTPDTDGLPLHRRHHRLPEAGGVEDDPQGEGCSSAWQQNPPQRSHSTADGSHYCSMRKSVQRYALKGRSTDVYASHDGVDPLVLGPNGTINLQGGGHHADGSSASHTPHPSDATASYSPPLGALDTDSQSASSASPGKNKSPQLKVEQDGDTANKDKEGEESDESSLEPAPGRRKTSAAFRPRGRKKRNKCSPEQLESLEAFFSRNRNPTGRVREELSKSLRMPERSVQVWFQNRRAKVKTLERRGVDPASYTPLVRRNRSECKSKEPQKAGSPSTASIDQRGSASRSVDKTEPQSVTALPTTALCIGSWRRVSPLVCFFSRRLQMLSWYINSEAVGFKLEMPWTSIKGCIFDGPTQPSLAERQEGVRHPLGHFMIELLRPPTFFMEMFRSVDTAGSGDGEGEGEIKAQKMSWRQCADFTEGQQATRVRVHILSGPYEQLRQAVIEFAESNEALEKLVRFRDTERGEAGGSGRGSTGEGGGVGGRGGAGDRTQLDALPGSLQHVSADLRAALDSPRSFGSGGGGDGGALPSPQRDYHADWSATAGATTAWQGYRPAPINESPGTTWEFLHDSNELSAAHTAQSSMSAYQLGATHTYSTTHEGQAHHLGSSPRHACRAVDVGSLKLEHSTIAEPLASPQPHTAYGDRTGQLHQQQHHHVTFHAPTSSSWVPAATTATEDHQPLPGGLQPWTYIDPHQPSGSSLSHSGLEAMGRSYIHRSYQHDPSVQQQQQQQPQHHQLQLQLSSSETGVGQRRYGPAEDERPVADASMRYALASPHAQDAPGEPTTHIHPDLTTSGDAYRRQRGEWSEHGGREEQRRDYDRQADGDGQYRQHASYSLSSLAGADEH